MRRVLEAIMHFPDYTAQQLFALLKTESLVSDQKNIHMDMSGASEKEIAEALFPRATVSDVHVAKSVRATLALLEDILHSDNDKLHMNDEINAAMKASNVAAGTNLSDHVVVSLGADDLVPIRYSLLPPDYSVQDYQIIYQKLKNLQAKISGIDAIYSSKLMYALNSLEHLIILKIPRTDPQMEAVRLAEARSLENEIELSDLDANLNYRKKIVDRLKRNDINNKDNHIDQRQYDSVTCFKTVATMQAVLCNEQEAIDLKNEINKQFVNYKNVLASYVLDKLKKAPQLCAYFLREVSEEAIIPFEADPDEDEAQNAADLQEAISAHEQAKKMRCMNEVVAAVDSLIPNATHVFAEKHLNFARAVANYKLIDEAEKKLNPASQSGHLIIKSPRLTSRLVVFYQDIPRIERSLVEVGDMAVDHQTKGIVGFFRKIWNLMKWSVSNAGKGTSSYKKTAVVCRERLFTLKHKLEPDYEVEKARRILLVRTLPSIRCI